MHAIPHFALLNETLYVALSQMGRCLWLVDTNLSDAACISETGLLMCADAE